MKRSPCIRSRLILLASAFFAAVPSSLAQAKSPQKSIASSPAADRLGMTCSQILAMTSTDWTAKFIDAKGSDQQNDTRATTTYGACYDAHTDSLAASLARKGAGPTKKLRADFAQLETAVKAFTAKALADVQPAPDLKKAAYISLYEKQFRREFYTEYEHRAVNRPLTPDESDQYRKAKNRFGELIGLLPEEKAHEVHRAFGDILGSQSTSLPMNLALYRYAIFILESASEKPFAPPPF